MAGLQPLPDAALEAVAAAFLSLDPEGARTARALRRTIDMLLDGRNTGRFRWEQLHKTEKTHAGTLVEINLQREFEFDGGDQMDYRIAGADVDCKFSQSFGQWMIPPEALGHLCLVIWFNDDKGLWSAGLVRIGDGVLNVGRNRDGKRTLSAAGRESVRWLFHSAPLPENALLRISDQDIAAIFAPRSGQQRVNELFRRAQGVLIRRSVVATVAQQDDYMKRVRYNGGARSTLQPEGIVIFGQYGSHTAVAQELGLLVPGNGDSLSIRLTRWTPDRGDVPRAEIDGAVWTVASPSDPVEPAPRLPER